MISGHGTIETAVRATSWMVLLIVIEKPLSLEKIIVLVANAGSGSGRAAKKKTRLLWRHRRNWASSLSGDRQQRAMKRAQQIAVTRRRRTGACAEVYWRERHPQGARRSWGFKASCNCRSLRHQRALRGSNCAANSGRADRIRAFGHLKAVLRVPPGQRNGGNFRKAAAVRLLMAT